MHPANEDEVEYLAEHLATCQDTLCSRIRERILAARLGTHRHWPDWACEMFHALDDRLDTLEERIMTNQEELDADVKAIAEALTVIEVEIDGLKAQAAAAAAPLDFSGMDAVLARLKGDEPPAPPADAPPADAPPADAPPADAPPADAPPAE